MVPKLLSQWELKGCRFRIGITPLLAGITLAVGLLGVCGKWLPQRRAERQAVLQIENLGGLVYYRWRFDEAIEWQQREAPWLPGWLVPGDGFVVGVRMSRCDGEMSDKDLVHLRPLRKLRWLRLTGSPITDAGLKHLAGLKRLVELDLRFTQVTDAGVANLSKLSHLKRLDLHGTQVTARGTEQLRRTLPQAQVRPALSKSRSCPLRLTKR